MIKYLYAAILFIGLIGISASPAGIKSAYPSDENNSLIDTYKKIESIKISFNGYTLGAELNNAQKKRAEQNSLPAAASGTYKFKDKNINIIADENTDRVLIIFGSFEKCSQQQLRDILGSLTIQFGTPTLSAHDKIIYWVYGENGKYSSEQFETLKELSKNRIDSQNRVNPKNKKDALSIIAAVKLQSEIPITEEFKKNSNLSKDKNMSKNKNLKAPFGKVYFVISSEKLLSNFL